MGGGGVGEVVGKLSEQRFFHVKGASFLNRECSTKIALSFFC